MFRGTTIMNYCGIDDRYLDYVVEQWAEDNALANPSIE